MQPIFLFVFLMIPGLAVMRVVRFFESLGQTCRCDVLPPFWGLQISNTIAACFLITLSFLWIARMAGEPDLDVLPLSLLVGVALVATMTYARREVRAKACT